MQITDNFLDNASFFRIQELFISSHFPWYYNHSVSSYNDPEDHYQFTHTFYKNFKIHSSFFDDLSPIINKLKPVSIVRIKSNLIPKFDKIVEHGLHIDAMHTSNELKTAVFYINTNNGYTLFQDGTKIESVANRMVIFDSKLLHCGTTCTDKTTRIVINFNYF